LFNCGLSIAYCFQIDVILRQNVTVILCLFKLGFVVSTIEGFCSCCDTLVLQSICLVCYLVILVAIGLFLEIGILFEVWKVDNGMAIWNSMLLNCLCFSLNNFWINCFGSCWLICGKCIKKIWMRLPWLVFWTRDNAYCCLIFCSWIVDKVCDYGFSNSLHWGLGTIHKQHICTWQNNTY